MNLIGGFALNIIEEKMNLIGTIWYFDEKVLPAGTKKMMMMAKNILS